MRWLGVITDSMDMSLMVKVRGTWRAAIHAVTASDMTE